MLLPVPQYPTLHIDIGEKYFVSGRSVHDQPYRIDIYRQDEAKWSEVYMKDVTNSYDAVNKMAASQATHMFCFSNNNEGVIQVGI